MTVQWRISDDAQEYLYVIRMQGATCTTRPGEDPAADTTLQLDLARFAQCRCRSSQGVKLLLTRKLKASGDIGLAKKMPTLFDIPPV